MFDKKVDISKEYGATRYEKPVKRRFIKSNKKASEQKKKGIKEYYQGRDYQAELGAFYRNNF